MRPIRSLLCLLTLVSLLPAQPTGAAMTDDNPFFSPFATPFGTPPFDRIRTEHFLPAMMKGMEEQRREVNAVANDTLPATFANTVEALDRTGDLLGRVTAVFFALQGANTNDSIQAIAAEVTPLLTQLQDDIYLNERLFRRVKTVYDARSASGLDAERMKLVEDYYASFVRGGATLAPEAKERFRAVNEELARLQLKFDENVLKETNAFRLVIERRKDLDGLPKSVVDASAEAATAAGLKGKWLFTVKKPSMLPFLTYAKNRDLRRQLLTAYLKRGDNGNEHDNNALAARIAALRVERSALLGFPTYAAFSLDRTMAKTPKNVYDLLDRLWEPALRNAKRERDAMQAMVKKEGGSFTIEPWDWWYYAERVRKERYDLDENELRPYFLMENVRKGVFDLATRLYGVRFEERKDITTYAEDVTVFEVKEEDGTHVGLLYTDYYPRAGKQAGAWCGAFRSQERRDGRNIAPLVTNVGNFSKPTAGQPSLLSMDEVETLFHEFGHALNALFSDATYKGLSVPGDIIELPSQIMENWAFHPEVMKTYALHYKTGKPIPAALVGKIAKSATFNQGFATTEYLAACYLDMDWHTLKSTVPVESASFERAALERIGLIPAVPPRYRSPFFLHIFSSPYYAAGYYYYIWAEVLDADAFEAFKENGLFDRATAAKFRRHILARLQADDAMTQYERFRGRKPDIAPLLKRRGLE